MDNEEFTREFGFNPNETRLVIEGGLFGKTVYKNASNFFKSFLLKGVMCGLVGLLGAVAINSSQKVRELNKSPVVSYIDRDNLADLIIGNRIYLANQKGDGIVYKRISSSDIHRIK